jgi:DNA transposition AAA+ family ATPase
MSKAAETNFIMTREYRRFAEFCDACRRYRYIGLCYGPPGVGKTLSARHYATWDSVEEFDLYDAAMTDRLAGVLPCETIFYTPGVTNSPGQIERDIHKRRGHLQSIRQEPLRLEENGELHRIQQREDEVRRQAWQRDRFHSPPEEPAETGPGRAEVVRAYHEKRKAIPDPTTLIVVDEADRLRVASLEQIRAIFDEGGIGVVLLGMSGLEKRLVRYPQFYSRVGFVHEFRALSVAEVRSLLEQHWKPPEIRSTLNGITDEEILVAIVRITGGNFRLLHRLLSQIARVMEINALSGVTLQVVDAARESLVIGTG